jgi:hypothetical protein
LIGAGREVHVEQQYVESLFPHQRQQPAGIAQSLHGGEVLLQQQSGGIEYVLIVIDD